ncbi:uncharacterized protein LOC115449190 [Manduca sexta]|uniref:uncharacterized protein LOC115449190 n=1 Tax=Manduca sexta TaxID=7130 RepID=UPI001181E1AE|nr:uncharacterized protein LOC115449190 [Manduca sexta]
MNGYLIILSALVNFSLGRDFYVGMFKRNDFLVAQDRLYKERRPFRYTVAKYGRLFSCPITFFRVVDRLGVGNGPRVQIIRGGLGKKYLTLQITSSYNYPISVNIYVGCSPERITTVKRPLSSSEELPVREDNASEEKEVKSTTRKNDTATTVGNGEPKTSVITGETSPAGDAVTTAAA